MADRTASSLVQTEYVLVVVVVEKRLEPSLLNSRTALFMMEILEIFFAVVHYIPPRSRWLGFDPAAKSLKQTIGC